MKLLEPGAVRAELRDGRSPSLARRRVVGLLAAIGLVDFALITLYQTAAGYLWNMAREQEKACAYCIVGADGRWRENRLP